MQSDCSLALEWERRVGTGFCDTQVNTACVRPGVHVFMNVSLRGGVRKQRCLGESGEQRPSHFLGGG